MNHHSASYTATHNTAADRETQPADYLPRLPSRCNVSPVPNTCSQSPSFNLELAQVLSSSHKLLPSDAFFYFSVSRFYANLSHFN